MTTGIPDSEQRKVSRKWLTGGWAKAAFALVFLVIAFYVEEDWRGAAAWKQAQVDIAVAGESLDPNKFIPPPVPDAQNFGLLPIFQFDAATDQTSGMDEAFAHASPNKFPYSKDDAKDKSYLPYLGNWWKGEEPDVPTIQARLAELCQSAFPSVTIPPDAKPTDLFGILCPTLAELRAANATHPVCRFDADYTTQPPFNRSLGGIVSQIKLAKILAYEERLAFLSGQPQLALDDLKVTWKADSGLRQEPILVAGLISVGVGAIQRGVIVEGLAEHAWNDQQLADLDNDLGKIDYLAECQLCLRGEAALFGVPMVDYLKQHRLKIQYAFGMQPPSTWEDHFHSFLSSCMAVLAPNGWFDRLKADSVRFHLLGAVKMVDPVSRRVFPEKEADALHFIQDPKVTSYWRSCLSSMLAPMLNSVRQFAYAQVQSDEARIACRLERYRLVHGVYPPSLDTLTPAYGTELPHDVMNGEVYHYKSTDDGSYLLYSVGWDQKDDGGNGTPPQYQPQSHAPDWPWPNHPETTKTK